jgi:hypothetical protein
LDTWKLNRTMPGNGKVTRGMSLSKAEALKNEVLINLAGKVAEEIFYGNIDFPPDEKTPWSGAEDFDKAFVAAKKNTR